MFTFWEDELSEREEEELLDRAAEAVRRRRLEVPAVLALEMHKPLAGIASHAAVALAPFLAPILGYDFLNDYSRLFSRRENVERLIRRIEEASAA